MLHRTGQRSGKPIDVTLLLKFASCPTSEYLSDAFLGQSRSIKSEAINRYSGV
jgi:hypothetical protein